MTSCTTGPILALLGFKLPVIRLGEVRVMGKSSFSVDNDGIDYPII
jgi:hypothetical protein